MLHTADETTTMEQAEAEAIRLQLGRILSSRSFATSPRMAAFLRYVVEAALAGDFTALKETCIGLAVFQRSADYDPREDGIVRVEARRLRQKLQEFYEGEGRADAWLVDLPRGGYRPSFSYRGLEQSEAPPALEDVPPTRNLPLVAVVEPANDAQDHFSARPKSGSKWVWPLAVAGTIAIAGCLLLFWLSFNGKRNASHDPTTAAKSLTTYIGQEMQATVSPDGHNFAFVWDGDSGHYNIYTRDVTGQAPKQLTSAQGHNLYPAWSPDGRDIAYVNVMPDGLSLMLQPSVGGAARTISQYNPPVSPWHEDARQITAVWSAGWTPDGRSLITNATRENEGKDRLALFSIRLSGGPEQQITFPTSGASDFEPAVSPDGRKLAFFRATSKQTGDIWLLNLGDGTAKQLTFDRSDIRGMTWTQDGQHLLYAGNRNGPYSIQLISAETGQTTLIPTPGTNATDPVLWNDGTHLIFTDSQENSNIWEQRLAFGKASSKPTRLISSSISSHSPRFSPDGNRIAFVSNRSGHWELWVSDAQGANPSQLTNFDGPLVDAPHWSPDGTRIVVEARPDGRSAIFCVDVAKKKTSRLTDGRTNDKMPVWSRDGRWIYFNSDANGYAQIWRMSADGSGRKLLTAQPGYDVVEPNSGPYLYFLSGDQYLYRAPLEGGESVRMDKLGRIGLSRYLDASGDFLYYISGASEPYRVDRFEFASGRVTPVTTIDGQILSSTPSLGVSNHGDALLYTLLESGGSDIKMVSMPR